MVHLFFLFLKCFFLLCFFSDAEKLESGAPCPDLQHRVSAPILAAPPGAAQAVKPAPLNPPAAIPLMGGENAAFCVEDFFEDADFGRLLLQTSKPTLVL